MSYLKLALLASAGLLVSAQLANADPMGREGYSFPTRNPSLAAQFDFQSRMANASSSSAANAGGLAALNQFATTYSSTSTSIGNMNTVTQILAEGSEGSVGQSTDQDSTGSQAADAVSDIAIDNSIVSTVTENNPPSEPAPE